MINRDYILFESLDSTSINMYVYIYKFTYIFVDIYLFHYIYIFIYGDHQTSSKQRKWSIKFRMGARVRIGI